MFSGGWRVRRRSMGALTIFVALAWAGWPRVDAKATMNPSLYAGLKWRMLGPFRGGRVDAVSGVRGRPHEFYFGAVNGGVWKTVDAGRIWTPIFDSQPVASIGALAVSSSEPTTIYVGTVNRRFETLWVTATVCTSPSMRGRRGRTSASRTHSTSAGSPSIRRMPVWSSSRPLA